MKIAIVGASISGLYLAYLLSREGAEVEVYEKEREGEAARRTLIVTNKINEILDFDAFECIINKINRYELIADGQKATIELSKPDFVIERKGLLELLVRQAGAAGAKIFWRHEIVEIKKLNHKLNQLELNQLESKKKGEIHNSWDRNKKEISYPNSIEPKDEASKTKNEKCRKYDNRGIFSLRIRDGESGKEKIINRDVVVLANGINSEILGIRNKKLALVQARVFFSERMSSWKEGNFQIKVYEGVDGPKLWSKDNSFNFAGDKDLREKTCQVWFDPNRTRYFIWLIPESTEVAAVGLIDEEMPKAVEMLRNFINENNFTPIEFQAALVPKYEGNDFNVNCFRINNGSRINNLRINWLMLLFLNRIFSKVNLNRNCNFYTVGDAAAQVKMTTVGGVVAGLRGAQALAEAILNQKVFIGKSSNNYCDLFRRLYFELDLHYILRRILNHFRSNDYALLLSKIEKDKELKIMLGRLNRDELARFLFKVILKCPWLISLALKIGISSLLFNKDRPLRYGQSE